MRLAISSGIFFAIVTISLSNNLYIKFFKFLSQRFGSVSTKFDDFLNVSTLYLPNFRRSNKNYCTAMLKFSWVSNLMISTEKNFAPTARWQIFPLGSQQHRGMRENDSHVRFLMFIGSVGENPVRSDLLGNHISQFDLNIFLFNNHIVQNPAFQ